MKKSYLAIAALLAACSFASAASAQEMPGSAWASLTANPSVVKDTPEDNNLLLQGRVEQGYIVGRVGDFKVNTFAAVNYSLDKNGLSYNNKLAPALGIKLQRPLGDNGILEIGIQAVHQRNFRGVAYGPREGTGIQAFVSFWSGWDLKK